MRVLIDATLDPILQILDHMKFSLYLAEYMQLSGKIKHINIYILLM